MFEKYLQDIGLSDKEAQVYLGLLQVDHDSVLDLAKKTKINRTTIYPVLDSLAKKGLISEIKVDTKVRYQAEPPERLETFVEQQKIALEEQSARLHDIVPQLKSIQRESGERPVVKVFEGREGIISSLEEYFKNLPQDSVSYSIYSKDLLDEVFSPFERKKFLEIRKSKKSISKAIYTRAEGEIPNSDPDKRVKIDRNKYPILCDISISGDEVVISTLHGHLTSISIKNNDVAQTIKSLVDFITDQHS